MGGQTNKGVNALSAKVVELEAEVACLQTRLEPAQPSDQTQQDRIDGFKTVSTQILAEAAQQV
jgi:hypothetical protein